MRAKLAAIQLWDLTGRQLYDCGSIAVEAALRVCRVATGRHEFIFCFLDFHGKSGYSISLSPMSLFYGMGRSQGFCMVPRPYPYRAIIRKGDGTIGTAGYPNLYDECIKHATCGSIAAIGLEPVQGWAGSAFPPDDFLPKPPQILRRLRYIVNGRRSAYWHGSHG
jgi:4-aminobutyrate aminotransferase-like enzyme